MDGSSEPGDFLKSRRAVSASDGLLEAIARAPRLTDDETAHLKDLARPASTSLVPPPVAHASVSARQLLAAMTDVPALILDRRNDVLAWNRLGHALLAGHLEPDSPDAPAARPNLTRMLFLDERYWELYTNCDEFASLWARHPVRTCASGVKDLRHPLVGAMELSFENLVLPGTSGQRLITFTAEPGSPSEAALHAVWSA